MAPLISPQSPPAVKQAARAALVKLIGAVPTPDEAVELLTQRAEEFFQQRQVLSGVVAGRVDVWRWDSEEKRPVKINYAVDDATRLMALRLAREAFAIRPEDPPARRLYLATKLESQAYLLDRDKLSSAETPGEAEAAKFATAVLEDVLAYGIAHHHPAAAEAVVRVLARKGSAAELLHDGGTPTPLVMALRQSDRRLQLAALHAIVGLKPQRPFAGSSYVTEALAFLVASHGERRVLVAAPSAAVAMQSLGGLTKLGYELDFAPVGREAIRQALTSPDYEFVFIDAGIDVPTVEFVVQELRRDFRTAALPVALMARDFNLPHAQSVAQANPLTAAFVRPHTPEALRWQVEQLRNLAGRDFVPFEVRRRQTLQALDLLADWMAGPLKSYDVVRLQQSLLVALANPPLAQASVRLLGTLGTPESQRALVDVASQTQYPLSLRQAAARAFAASVKKFRVLLTTGEIVRQYDRYNHSEKLDRASQAVLSSLLDSLEGPSQAAQATQEPKRPGATKPLAR